VSSSSRSLSSFGCAANRKVGIWKAKTYQHPYVYPQALGSLFVASYYSQGYGGGIRPRFHAGFSSRI
jgi:hypothetical protein